MLFTLLIFNHIINVRVGFYTVFMFAILAVALVPPVQSFYFGSVRDVSIWDVCTVNKVFIVYFLVAKKNSFFGVVKWYVINN